MPKHKFSGKIYEDNQSSVSYRTDFEGFPGDSDGEEFACNAGDPGLIPGLGRYPREGSNPLQYSCLGNPMDREAWQATVHGVAKSWTVTNVNKCKWSLEMLVLFL